MKNLKKMKRLYILAAIVMAVFMMGGCGGDKDDDEQTGNCPNVVGFLTLTDGIPSGNWGITITELPINKYMDFLPAFSTMVGSCGYICQRPDGKLVIMNDSSDDDNSGLYDPFDLNGTYTVQLTFTGRDDEDGEFWAINSVKFTNGEASVTRSSMTHFVYE